MYGTTETITTYDKIEPLYWAVKRAVEEGFPEWNIKFIAHFSHWFHWGVMLLLALHHRGAAGRRRRRRCNCTTASGTPPCKPSSKTAA